MSDEPKSPPLILPRLDGGPFGPRPPENPLSMRGEDELGKYLDELGAQRRRTVASREQWTTFDDVAYVPARILWPALGFPAVVDPHGNDPHLAARTICVLLLSNRDPDRNPLSKRDVARHLRLMPWAERRKRYSPRRERGGVFAFNEVDIEVRRQEKLKDDGRAQIIKLGADADDRHGFLLGLSSWVRAYYAGRLPDDLVLPYLYEVRIAVHAVQHLMPDQLYNLAWINRSRNDDENDRSEELDVLIENFARRSRFGHDGVLPPSGIAPDRRADHESEHLGEYEFEFREPRDAAHRTEVYHPVFVRPAAPTLRIGHVTDLHMDLRIDAYEQHLQLSRSRTPFHNWNRACLGVYSKAKSACDVLLMTGDLINYGRGHNGKGPLGKDSSYWRDRNWFLFYRTLVSGERYTKPVYTSLGNHDWRLNPYPPFTFGAPKHHELGTTEKGLRQAHGAGHDRKTYATEFTMILDALGELFFTDGEMDIKNTPLETRVESVAWYLLAINPFLDYTWALPGGFNFVMLDWAEAEVVDQDVILGGRNHGKKRPKPDAFGGPTARNCLTDVQKALVDYVAGQYDGAKILGIHAPPIGPFPYWTEDDLAQGRVRYLRQDVHVMLTRVAETDEERDESLHRMRGADIDPHQGLMELNARRPLRGGAYPTLAIRTARDEPLGREATCGSFVRERNWLIRTLRSAKFSITLAGHIHRRDVLVIDDTGGPALLPGSRGKWVVRTVPSGKPPAQYGPLFVNSTSAGPLGHLYPERGRYETADPGYTEVVIAASGIVDSVEFVPETSRAPVASATPVPDAGDADPVIA